MKDYSYTYLSGAETEDETTYVKVGRGMLHRIVVGETNSTHPVLIYDGTDGGANNVQIGELKASVGEGSYEFNCRFANGLYVGNKGNSKLTIVWN